MDLRLKGKKAVITGATRGIGRAVAETLAAEGADVAICARDSRQVEEAVKALTGKGVRALGAVVDVADGAALTAWVQQVGREFGGIDVLVSNATAFGLRNSEQDWQGSFQIDVMGAVRMLEAATPYLEQAAAANGDAAIVFLSSVAAAEAEFESAYGAAKAALIHLAKGVARRQAPKHIRANVVSPGTIYIKDGFWHKAEQHMPAQYAAYLKRNPMGRMGTAQEVANAVAFLASPAASFITGVNLVIDGALSARVNY